MIGNTIGNGLAFGVAALGGRGGQAGTGGPEEPMPKAGGFKEGGAVPDEWTITVTGTRNRGPFAWLLDLAYDVANQAWGYNHNSLNAQIGRRLTDVPEQRSYSLPSIGVYSYGGTNYSPAGIQALQQRAAVSQILLNGNNFLTAPRPRWAAVRPEDTRIASTMQQMQNYYRDHPGAYERSGFDRAMSRQLIDARLSQNTRELGRVLLGPPAVAAIAIAGPAAIGAGSQYTATVFGGSRLVYHGTSVTLGGGTGYGLGVGRDLAFGTMGERTWGTVVADTVTGATFTPLFSARTVGGRLAFGGLAGFGSNTIEQSVDLSLGDRTTFDLWELGGSTATGAAGGWAAGRLPDFRFRGITSGRNNYVALFQRATTLGHKYS